MAAWGASVSILLEVDAITSNDGWSIDLFVTVHALSCWETLCGWYWHAGVVSCNIWGLATIVWGGEVASGVSGVDRFLLLLGDLSNEGDIILLSESIGEASLDEVYRMTINNDVLSVIVGSLVSVLMWYGWLVHGPVVVWWVDNWVLDLGESVGLLLECNGIWANDNVHVELSLGHIVLHDNWLDVDWDSLGEGGLLDNLLD